jgi:hypothetical protein
VPSYPRFCCRWQDGAPSPPRSGAPTKRAIDFLLRETPAWRRENGCFSCHNNGDGARALFAASRRGYPIPPEALGDTVAWLANPWVWDQNKGDPGFSDKRLADIQFASALLAALESGWAGPGPALPQAAARLIEDQSPDGAWEIGQGFEGSPATYGPVLATSAAIAVLQASGIPEARPAIERARAWLQRCQPSNAVATAVLSASGAPAPRGIFIDILRQVQTREGGWGPFADSPPEPFDTAVVLLALAPLQTAPEIRLMIQGGRKFLRDTQGPDGSWPATTRPPGGRSYAQQVSTTAWATLALLATEPSPSVPRPQAPQAGKSR